MLKIAGIVLVLAAAWGYGSGLVAQLVRHRDNLFACKEMTELLIGEIRYGKTPLQDAFSLIAARLKEPLSGILKSISKEICQNNYKSLEVVWENKFQAAQKELYFTAEEMEVVKGIGKNLGYLDVQMQVQHLTLYQKQMAGFLEQTEKTEKEKKKLYRSLSMMAGAMVVLLLV
ncbi:stage III sporulation protein SpoAB [uncultured Roseburia sp.]|uniref:Stage III sporulation protein AB n=1 Tax=Brotonthovivens ammoniilytica TaxID=2981725 RepID=A0ABT2TFL4_9FIRM|nr:stage III sporulation protein AB [Brotonthovivens ammoniilytica]MCU6760969.1 stage III sporulation protein AB [Brotonthovivens ammoniilytica]SCI14945.1 stage III sporulation protein SpoAB [uncultured Roseburia sp.]